MRCTEKQPALPRQDNDDFDNPFYDDDEDEEPFDLMGASRTLGDTFRGKALGNTHKMADNGRLLLSLYKLFALTLYYTDIEMGDDSSRTYQIIGKILLFTDRKQSVPEMSMCHPIGTNLEKVLYSVSDVYSSIRHKTIISN